MSGAGEATSRGETFSPAFLAELRTRTPMPPLVSRDVRLSRNGNLWKGLCPFHGEKRPSFCVYPDHYHCFSCGVHGDAVRYMMDRRNLSFPDAVRELARDAGMLTDDGAARSAPASLAPVVARESDEDREKRRRHAQQIWLAAQPTIVDTPVENYLKNRNIDLRSLGRAPRALRFHPGLWHAKVCAHLPAMVTAITNGAGEHIATHRTWLECAGGGWIKARIPDNKMVLGSFAGGSIRLWRGASGKSLAKAPAGEPVVIAEGIESGLSIAVAIPEIRVLAAVSLGNLGGVELPPQIGPVILAIDNDHKPAALAAKARAVNRWLDRGVNIRVARSPIGNDFNDCLREYA